MYESVRDRPRWRGVPWGVTYGLAERPALADGNLVTLDNTEGGGDVGGEVLVALLVTGVLGDEVKVLAADDERPVHLGGDDGAVQDAATDGDLAGEGALLVCREAWLASRSKSCIASIASSNLSSRKRHSPSFIASRKTTQSSFLASFVSLHPSSYSCVQRTDVGALNGSLGGTETKTDILVPAATTLARASRLRLGLLVLEDGLLLERALRLDGEFGGHIDGCDAVTALVREDSSDSVLNREVMRKGDIAVGIGSLKCFRSGTYLQRSWGE
jgi:hypothetical protein